MATELEKQQAATIRALTMNIKARDKVFNAMNDNDVADRLIDLIAQYQKLMLFSDNVIKNHRKNLEKK